MYRAHAVEPVGNGEVPTWGGTGAERERERASGTVTDVVPLPNPGQCVPGSRRGKLERHSGQFNGPHQNLNHTMQSGKAGVVCLWPPTSTTPWPLGSDGSWGAVAGGPPTVPQEVPPSALNAPLRHDPRWAPAALVGSSQSSAWGISGKM